MAGPIAMAVLAAKTLGAKALAAKTLAAKTLGAVKTASLVDGLNVASGAMGVMDGLKGKQGSQVQPQQYQSQSAQPGAGTMIDPGTGGLRVKRFSDYFKEGMSDVQ